MQPTSIQVNLSGVSATPRLQPGSTAQITLTPASGNFSGTVSLAGATVTFTDSSGNAKSSTPTAQSASGSQITLTFPVPAITPTAASAYQVTVQGATTGNQNFTSTAPVAATVYPATTITSVLPTSAHAGQTVTVSLIAANSDFVQGQTQATFGAGIAVNGAGAGLPGLIAVTSTNAATATLVIDPAAAVGTRTITITTQGQVATLAAGFTVQPALLPLVASAGGPYTGYSGRTVQFDGSKSSDPNGLTLSYAWNFGDGATGTGAQPTHSYAKGGAFTVQLTVSDPTGLTATSSTTATVSTLGNPTAVGGGPYTGTTGNAIAFDGSASTDPNSSTLTYAWAFGDGATGTGAKATHAYTTAGTYAETLTVTDTYGLSAMATSTVTVSNAVQAPTANAGGPYSGAAGATISFSGAGSSDPQGQTLSYAWDFGDGTTGTGASPTHAYTNAGSYTVHLTVTNTSGLTASATAAVTVTAAAKNPTAVPGGPYTGTVGVAVSFNGMASTDPQGQTLTYAWDFGDKSAGTGVSPSHSYAAAGSYTVTLTVTDTAGLTGSATATVTIAAAGALTANPGGPYTGNPGVAVTFSGAASSDPKGETLTYAWDFGDGNTGTGVSPTHTYTDATMFTVTLTVTNTDGATASATSSVTIAYTLQAMSGGPYTGNVNQMLAFSGLGSTAPGTDTLSYAWTFGDGSTGTGATPAHTYTSAGAFNIGLTVSDTATKATNTSATTATITAPPQITFTSPAQGALFNTTTIQVAGTAATSVKTVTVNGVAATLTSGVFSATVPVRAGVNILTATGTDASGNVGTASTSVTVDLSPPTISVLQPANGSTVTTQQIAVSGMVTDQVTGTVNGSNVTVTVNGQAATVSNRSFLLPSLLLVPGANTLNFVATDAAGNQSTSTVSVTYSNTAAQQHIVVLSGAGQSGQINSVLPQPLVVQLVSPTGTPVPDRAVTFTVTASDGTVESLPLQAQTLNLMTDAQGKASVLFQLGSRAGLGINQVAVTSPGFAGGTVFTETTTAGPATHIHEFMGNNQRGIIGQPLAEGFQVIVQDSGGDPIANVPVTYTVTTGDGLFAGSATSTVMTNSDGRALATLALGQQEGINNNTVLVDFTSDPNPPVTFYASGFSSGAAANTSVTGVVLDNALNAVPNATVSLLNTSLMTTTDANGRFSLTSVPVGTTTLLVDGSTTSLAETLPSLSFILQALPGQNNTLNMPVYLPIIDTSSAKTVGGSLPVTLSMSTLPGVALTVAPNSVTFPDGTHVGQLTVSQVKSDLVPMPPPNGIMPSFAWTIQPAGTIFSTPVTITVPNTTGLPPGQVQEFYQYDHDLEQFVSVGTLRVSPDGSVLNSDPSFGITKAGWATPGSNPPGGGCGQSCDDNNSCTTDSQDNNTCRCTHTPNGQQGACFTNPPPGPNNCMQPGKCDPATGQCSSKPKGPGSSCDDGLFCTSPDTCTFDGQCRGVNKLPFQIPFNGLGAQANIIAVLNNIQMMFGSALGPTASNFVPTIGIMGQQNDVCCETQKKFVPNATGSFQAGGQITTPTIFLDFPPYSLPFGINGGGYGLSGNLSAQLMGTLTADFNECTPGQQVTLGGSVMLQAAANIMVGAALNYPNGAPLVALQLQTAVGLEASIMPAPGLGQFYGQINSLPVQLQFIEQVGGVVFPTPVWSVVGGKTYYQGTFSIPLPSP